MDYIKVQKDYDGSGDPLTDLGKNLWNLEKKVDKGRNSKLKELLEDSISAFREVEKSIKKSGEVSKTEHVRKERGNNMNIKAKEELPDSVKDNPTPDSENDSWAEIEKQAERRVRDGGAENFADGVTEVVKEYPELYRKYREAKYNYPSSEGDYGEYPSSSGEGYDYHQYAGAYQDYSAPGESAWKRIRQKAKDLLNSHNNNLDNFPDAVREVLENNRKLYRAYRKEKTAEYKEVEKAKQPRQRLG